MIDELKQIEKLLFEITSSKLSNVIVDAEAKEYFGYNFEHNKQKFKFRKSKITPKKVGQFVTLWKRNLSKETEPFNEIDDFDFYIIFAEENDNNGFFVFPKNELINRQILSTKSKEGKRGFRVYPSWTKTGNKQAEKTQSWQISYFIDFSINELAINQRLLEIIHYV